MNMHPRHVLGLFLLAWSGLAHGDFKGYFDVSALELPALVTPAWGRSYENNRLRYFCATGTDTCGGVMAVDIKGVLRTEALPAAFQASATSSALSITELRSQGEANAQRLGSRFHGVFPLSVEGIQGLRMEASGGPGSSVNFVTIWLGRGDWLLDVKITGSDLDKARAMAEGVARILVPQVFK
jgi:hypothetical protein